MGFITALLVRKRKASWSHAAIPHESHLIWLFSTAQAINLYTVVKFRATITLPWRQRRLGDFQFISLIIFLLAFWIPLNSLKELKAAVGIT